MPRTRLVLASASPARRALLQQVGICAHVQASAVDESALVADLTAHHGLLEPPDLVLALARAKAEDVANDHDSLVLGCDSMLELDGHVHGKPADAAEEAARWALMSGRWGTLHTGHWLIDRRADGTGGQVGATASTLVHFARLSPEEIAAYVATGEPLRVAGGFTVDGLGGAFVTGIEGDHHNVVGLSLPVLRDLLTELGVGWFDLTQ